MIGSPALTPAGLRAPASGPEHPGIEALRGLAAVMVMISHYVVFVREGGAGPWGLAATGVDLFFVLSGFVFARTLAQPMCLSTGLGPHLVRRFFRLYPLYLLALLLYAALRPAEDRWSGWWAHVFMLHTTADLTLASFYNVAFWSLPPEVEFYLLLPVLAAGVAAWPRRLGSALWCLLTAALVLKLGLVALAETGEPPDSLRSTLTVHLPGLLVEFMLGCAAAVAGGHVRAPGLASAWSPAARRMAVGAGVLLLVECMRTYVQQLSTPQAAAQASLWITGNLGLGMALAFALMLQALPPAPSGGLGAGSVALWAGRLSYGLYLLHNAAPPLLHRVWPELAGAPLVCASVVLTVVLATALHLLVEAPCRAYGRSLASAWQRRAISRQMSAGSR